MTAVSASPPIFTVTTTNPNTLHNIVTSSTLGLRFQVVNSSHANHNILRGARIINNNVSLIPSCSTNNHVHLEPVQHITTSSVSHPNYADNANVSSDSNLNAQSPNNNNFVYYIKPPVPNSYKPIIVNNTANHIGLNKPQLESNRLGNARQPHCNGETGLTSIGIRNNQIYGNSPGMTTHQIVDCYYPPLNEKKLEAQHFYSPTINETPHHNHHITNGHSSGRRSTPTDRAGKGLRHFSMKVCEKVHRKGVTTYNEVADELVAEFALSSVINQHHSNSSMAAYDHKNIRRRVYDALNVLMAMNIISKEKKEIRWIGLPTNSMQECSNMMKEKERRIEQIKEKQSELNKLLLKQIALKNLIERNKTVHISNNKTLKIQESSFPSNSPLITQPSLFLPFILINTDKSTIIDCNISNDKCEYYFNFNNAFEVIEDFQIMKKLDLTMGLDDIGEKIIDTQTLTKALALVPKVMQSYVKALAGVENVSEQLTFNPLTLLDQTDDESKFNVKKCANNDRMPELNQQKITMQSSFVLNNDALIKSEIDAKSINLSNPSSLYPYSGPITTTSRNIPATSLATLQFKTLLSNRALMLQQNQNNHKLVNSNFITNNGVKNFQIVNKRIAVMDRNGEISNSGSDKVSSTSTSEIFSSEDSVGSQSNNSSSSFGYGGVS
ncbi:unnamed protein product [Gordionus sp. m RMFG-2023]